MINMEESKLRVVLNITESLNMEKEKARELSKHRMESYKEISKMMK